MSARSRRRQNLAMLGLPDRCVAHKKNGDQCRLRPMTGSAVCQKHGGMAPQVRRKAAERLALASEIAAERMVAFMVDPEVPYAVRLAAMKDVLDRADVKGKTTVELEVKPWEELLDGIVAEVSEDANVRKFERPGDLMVVNAERVDDYAIDNADYSTPEAAGVELPDTWTPRTEEPHRAREASARPQANGDDRPPPPRYAPTGSGPRSRRSAWRRR
jgi:hypothetical protein